MKSTITFLLLILSLSICWSQNLMYEIRNTSVDGISKEKLLSAETLNDLRPVYSAPMRLNYTSTELIVHTNEGVRKAKGSNEKLNEEQKSLLQKADIGNKISMVVKYLDKNTVTQFPDIYYLKFDVSVVPSTEAMFPGGHDDLLHYLEENVLGDIAEKFSKMNKMVVIKFVINESGKVADVQLSQASKDADIDRVLLKAINNMPEWKPAKNAMGVKIQQEFEFTLSNGC